MELGVYRILDKANTKLFHIQYYCGRRDSDFDDKMHNILVVYIQMSMCKLWYPKMYSQLKKILY